MELCHQYIVEIECSKRQSYRQSFVNTVSWGGEGGWGSKGMFLWLKIVRVIKGRTPFL